MIIDDNARNATPPNKKRVRNVITNEEDFKKIIASGKPKIALGDGLYFSRNKSGGEYFQFRQSINGKQVSHQIRKYPEVSFTEARKTADELLQKTKEKKIENSKKKFNTKLKSAKATSHSKVIPCFRKIDDLNEFIDKLKVKAPVQNIKYRGFISPPNLIAETHYFIWLLLLTPLSVKDLASLKWNNVFSTGYTKNIFVYNYPQNTGGYDHTQVFNSALIWLPENKQKSIALSILSSSIINNLLTILYTNGNLYIFQEFSKLNEKDQKRELDKAIGNIWVKYEIDIAKIKQLFIQIASEHSPYKREFVRLYSNTSKYDHYCIIDKIGLATWWERAIIDNRCNFKM